MLFYTIYVAFCDHAEKSYEVVQDIESWGVECAKIDDRYNPQRQYTLWENPPPSLRRFTQLEGPA